MGAVVAKLFDIVDDNPALYRFQLVSEFEDDPDAQLIARVEHSLIQAWMPLFEADEEMVAHPLFKGVAHAWLVGIISIFKGIAESRLVARDAAQRPNKLKGPQLSQAQQQFAQIERGALEEMLVKSVAKAMESIVIDTYELLTDREATAEKAQEIRQHVHSFGSYEQRNTDQ
ncbi:hypothetical protein [Trueperella pecoris]|uniref:hypothetical protein n=1 Tax=Trueperella pecoris TaxID=2733571 RepID=UPI00186B956A|nr:hypothetical protein [Trueperella pecoris]QOQ39486.1 hypothetical protein HLG82_08585 [Trueperella pecoris]